MKIYLGADHRGFKLKETIKKHLKLKGVELEDLGAETLDPNDDYVDYANLVVNKIENKDKGILFCGSGHGVDIAANRNKNIRSIIGFNQDVVVQGRQHEDANVLSLPSDWISDEEAKDMVDSFLNTNFTAEERHKRRLEKLSTVK